jgi:hypothetical protein
MERRVGLRARTDFRVIARDGSLESHCRGIEVSTTGIIVDRGKPVARRDQRLLLGLELRLPERLRALKAVARPVWSRGNQQAFRFVKMSDVDRLTLAEHLDVLRFRGVPMG